MATAAGYVGAVASLTMMLGTAAGAVAFGVAGIWPAAGVLTISSVLFGTMVVLNDWPRIWKPLFKGGR